MSFDNTLSEADESAAADLDESPKFIPRDEYAMQKFCKKLLKSRVFLANYLERRLVSEAIGYRDVVSVSEAERELKRDLQIIRIKLKNFYPSEFWVGITNPVIPGAPLGDCLWVELSNVPFGAHWFQVKTVRFRKNEVLLKLQCIRSLYDINKELPLHDAAANENKSCGESSHTTYSSSDGVGLSDFVQRTRNDAQKYFHEFLTLLTISNIFEVTKFLVVTILALITGTFYLVGNLGDFTLRLFRETSVFIHSATPAFIVFMDCCSKLVGGFYILIAMLFQGRNASRFNPQLNYKRNDTNRTFYDDTRSATLTEID